MTLSTFACCFFSPGSRVVDIVDGAVTWTSICEIRLQNLCRASNRENFRLYGTVCSRTWQRLVSQNKLRDKAPTSSDRKDNIKAWLDKQHPVQQHWHRLKEHRPASLYLTDKAANEQGHSVLRPPVAHWELDPIEMAWATVKNARNNRRYTLEKVELLTPAAFAHTTADMWRNL